eukprot:CAMPEP_0197579694 /NCGR_PEP_ID=MMETSP1326-20131121/3650_1 /TAXON_ID=1155430 /ORGANISM="Genus nov. species nov., Strain RCC2288" /LENGTH=66 /DNA_ID=CAMNT_0043143235 /DNA_START=308 /DNA_END=505 /DNA_ORIENTATION=-
MAPALPLRLEQRESDDGDRDDGGVVGDGEVAAERDARFVRLLSSKERSLPPLTLLTGGGGGGGGGE